MSELNGNQRERQYEIDHITFAYAEEARRLSDGENWYWPDIEPYVRDFPQYADEIRAYAADLEANGLPEPIDEPETLELTEAGKRALAEIRAQWERSDTPSDS
jgi:hypothetical protein